jgi:hypothetical protein
MHTKNNLIKIALIAIALFIVINNFIFSPGNILSWDVFGYYLYLPLKFIYHNLALKDFSVIHAIIGKYNNTATFYQAMQLPDGSYVMKYTMGLSFFYAPFFFIGHLIAKIFNFPADGFSLPYQFSIFIGGIIYSLIGIWALSKVLLRFFNGKTVVLILITIVFGTNYLVHITMYGQNAISHNYLFTMYALILWLTILWHESYKLKYIIFLGIVCGFTILSRPSEIVCLLIPALWSVTNFNSLREKLRMLFLYKKQIILFAVLLFVIGMFQLVYWKIITGKFLYYSYGGNAGEGFEFFKPYIMKVLFSFRKGWLIYTPVMVFAILGFYNLFRKNKPIFYALLIYFIANLYIISSWSCWWYAQSFSQRALIPSYPIMAIVLGYFLDWINEKTRVFRVIVYVLLACFTILNIFQTIQFHYGIIDGDRMTKKYYTCVFGKMKVSENDRKLLLIKRSFDGSEYFNNENAYNCKLLKKLDFENSEKKDSTQHYSGKYSFKLDSLSIFSPTIESPYYELTNKGHAWIRVTAYIFPTRDVSIDPFSLVVHFVHNGWPYKYYTFDSPKMNLELNKWNRISFNYLSPEVRRNRDYLKVYFWNRGKGIFFIDDLQVEIFEEK